MLRYKKWYRYICLNYTIQKLYTIRKCIILCILHWDVCLSGIKCGPNYRKTIQLGSQRVLLETCIMKSHRSIEKGALHASSCVPLQQHPSHCQSYHVVFCRPIRWPQGSLASRPSLLLLLTECKMSRLTRLCPRLLSDGHCRTKPRATPTHQWWGDGRTPLRLKEGWQARGERVEGEAGVVFDGTNVPYPPSTGP